MAINTDDTTMKLINEVNRQKKEIASLERINWKTNCSFSYTENPSNSIPLQVETDVRKLVLIVAFLLEKEASYIAAAKLLGIESTTPELVWNNFPINAWIEDIGMRIKKVQIADKHKRLETLEARLNAIISPELRAELELKDVQKMLGLE